MWHEQNSDIFNLKVFFPNFQKEKLNIVNSDFDQVFLCVSILFISFKGNIQYPNECVFSFNNRFVYLILFLKCLPFPSSSVFLSFELFEASLCTKIMLALQMIISKPFQWNKT